MLSKIEAQVKIKKVFLIFWPIIYIAIVWFLFAYPYFIHGKVPYASTYQVNFFAPWSHYEKFWGPVKNNAMPDVHTQIYPWKKFTIESLQAGNIPFWNPYSFSGNPHIANFQSAVFSPFNLFFFIFPFIDAWSIVVLLQPLLAGFFMYLLQREFQISKIGSLIGSTAFMFCGFIVVWMAYGTLAMAIAFLPFVLLTIEKYFKNQSFLALVLFSIGLVISFFSGHFQTSLYLAGFSFSFLFFRAIATKKKKEFVWIFCFFVIGIMLSLFQLIPSIELYQHSVRKEIPFGGGGIPFRYLITLLAPDFYGNPVTRNDWFGFYAEWSSFIGIIPFVLALFSLFRKKNFYTVFFTFASFATLLFAMDTPLHKLLAASRIPVLFSSAPSRIIVLSSFSLSVLAGFGSDTFFELLKKRFYKKLLTVILAVSVGLLLIWISVLFFDFLPAGKNSIALKNLILPSLLLATSFAFVVFSILIKNKPFLSIVVFLLLILSTFDSLRFVKKWMPFDPKELVFPDTAVVTVLKRHIGTGRVFGNLGTEVTAYYGIASLEGYDPLYIQRYGEFIRSASTGEFIQAERSVVKLDRTGEYTDRVLDLLGVSIIFHPIVDTNQGWAYPVWKNPIKYSVLYQDEKFQLFKNNTALKRVSLFDDYEVIEKKEEILKRFYSENFNFKKILILEEKPDFQKSIGKTGKAEIVLYTPGLIRIKVSTDHSSLLFLSDNYYPLWKAKVNGIVKKTYRADYTFRAIVVPTGESIVEFFI